MPSLNPFQPDVSAQIKYKDKTIEELLVEFEALPSSESESFAMAQTKYIIIECVHKKILQALGERIEIPVQSPLQPIPIHYTDVLSPSFYNFVAMFGITQHGIGSYLFAMTLFKLIPYMNVTSLTTTSVIYAVLDCLVFYAFEITFLRKAFLPKEANDAGLMNDCYSAQIDLITQINLNLCNFKMQTVKPGDAKLFIKCKNIFNEHLIKKSKTKYQYVWWKDYLKYMMISCGILSSIVDSYFLANGALLLLGVSLTHPVGLLIVACFMISAVGIHLSMVLKSIDKFLNPDLKGFNALQSRLKTFVSNYPNKKSYGEDNSSDGVTREAIQNNPETASLTPHSFLTRNSADMQKGLQRSYSADDVTTIQLVRA